MIIAIVIVLIVVVIGGIITLHKHVDKNAKEIMVRFSTVTNKKKVSDSNQDNNENV